LKDDAQNVSRKSVAKEWFTAEEDQGFKDFWFENLRLLICVVEPEAGQSSVKDIPSTKGMQLSLQTSELLQLRLENDLPGKHIA